MSYYMGDYRGDFYQGDPGIGSFFGGLARSIGGMIPGIGSFISKIGTKAKPAAGAMSAAAGAIRSGIVKHPVLSAAGAAGALAGGETLMRLHPSVAGAGMKGMHMSKAHRGVAPHLVRNRRMNFANPRALRRATRRLHAFARHYRHVIGFVSPKKPKGRMYFKARRRKAA